MKLRSAVPLLLLLMMMSCSNLSRDLIIIIPRVSSLHHDIISLSHAQLFVCDTHTLLLCDGSTSGFVVFVSVQQLDQTQTV